MRQPTRWITAKLCRSRSSRSRRPSRPAGGERRSCQPLGPGCDAISTKSGSAQSSLGLNAVDSASMPTNPLGDIEPPDQGLCTGGNSVVETNNIGEISGLQPRR